MKAEELLLVGDLFDSLGWPTDVAPDSQFPDIFDRFCRMLARVDEGQRALLLEITKSYTWITPDVAPKRFLAAWRQMVPVLPLNIQTVAVVPLLKPGSKRPKSSDGIFYMAQGYQANLGQSLHPRKLVFCKSASTFARYHEGVSDVALVLVDDYVGSGDTARKALARISHDFPKTNPSVIILLALAAQRKAIELLDADRCLVVAGQVLERGISDTSTLGDIPGALRKMDQIGRRLGIKKEDRLGYGATEALATLTRTPNNTFPVYWTNKKVSGEVWDSPFTRFTDRVLRG